MTAATRNRPQDYNNGITIMASSLSNRMSTSRPDAPRSAEPVRSLPCPTLAAELATELGSSVLEPAPSPFILRTVRQADLAALSEVLASSFHHPEGWLRWLYPVLRTGIYEDLRSRMHSRGEHYACLVAVHPGFKAAVLKLDLQPDLQPEAISLLSSSDIVVGSIEMNLKQPSLLQPWHQKYLYLSNLAVQADYRRQGVAQMLLQLCDRTALDWGFNDLHLHVLESNHAARRLYWKAGYRVQRIETSPFSLLWGQPRQLFLHKRLK